MKQRSFINNLITITVCLSVFWNIFTPIKMVISGGQTLLNLIPVMLIFVFDGMIRRKSFWVISIISIIIFFLNRFGVEYFNGFLSRIVSLFFYLFCIEHYLITQDNKFGKWVLITLYGLVISLSVISIPQFILVPNLTRLMVEAFNNPEFEFDYYWTISYWTIHMVPSLSIPLFALYKQADNRKIKLLSSFVLILLLIMMVFSDATIPLIMMLLLLLLFIGGGKSINLNPIKLLVIIIFCIPLVSPTVMTSMLRVIKPIFSGSTNFTKIDDLIYFFEANEIVGDMGTRWHLYQISFNSFCSHPLSPEMMASNIGNHSYLLDHLAAMGFILFVPLIYFFIFSFSRSSKLISKFKVYHVLSIVLFFSMALFKNISLYGATCLFVPLSLIMLENDDKRGLL